MTSYILQPPDHPDFPWLHTPIKKTELLINSDTILQKKKIIFNHLANYFPGIKCPILWTIYELVPQPVYGMVNGRFKSHHE